MKKHISYPIFHIPLLIAAIFLITSCGAKAPRQQVMDIAEKVATEQKPLLDALKELGAEEKDGEFMINFLKYGNLVSLKQIQAFFKNQITEITEKIQDLRQKTILVRKSKKAWQFKKRS